MSIAANMRMLRFPGTGVHRYLTEILRAFPTGANIYSIAPSLSIDVASAHAWEQLVLPNLLHGKLLWSPGNTGPLAVRRQVITIHDVVPLDHPEWYTAAKSLLYRFLTPKLVERVARVITISNFSKDRLIERTGIAEERVSVIYNGVDKRFTPQSKEAVTGAMGNVGIPCQNYIFCVGSTERRKNVLRVLRAWEVVSRRLPDDLWLVVSGVNSGALLGRGSGKLEKLPSRVFLTTHVPDELLPAIYSGAYVFVYASLYEGFGLPALEAMASGTPTLVGNRTSLPEVVGDAALQVDPYDVEAIADGVCRLVDDDSLRTKLRQEGFKQARLFAWDRTAKETWQVLQAEAQG